MDAADDDEDDDVRALDAAYDWLLGAEDRACLNEAMTELFSHAHTHPTKLPAAMAHWKAPHHPYPVEDVPPARSSMSKCSEDADGPPRRASGSSLWARARSAAWARVRVVTRKRTRKSNLEPMLEADLEI